MLEHLVAHYDVERAVVERDDAALQFEDARAKESLLPGMLLIAAAFVELLNAVGIKRCVKRLFNDLPRPAAVVEEAGPRGAGQAMGEVNGVFVVQHGMVCSIRRDRGSALVRLTDTENLLRWPSHAVNRSQKSVLKGTLRIPV